MLLFGINYCQETSFELLILIVKKTSLKKALNLRYLNCSHSRQSQESKTKHTKIKTMLGSLEN